VVVNDEAGAGWRAPVAGLLATVTGLAVAQLVAALVRGTASPVVVVGEWVVDLAPAPVKRWAIDTFGTADKVALVVGTLVLLFGAGALLGRLAVRRPVAALAGVAVFGLLGAVAGATRPEASPADALPSVAGALAAGAALWLLVRPLRPHPAADELPAPLTVDRRGFLVAGIGVGAVAVSTGSVGWALRHRFAVDDARRAVVLPQPGRAAGRLPADADLGIDGASPFTTPTRDFYRIDTALLVPQVDPAGWRLGIRGMVDRPLELSYDDLLARPLVERDITIACVSNEVGGRLVGNARWLGVPLADLLAEAGVQPGATQLVSRSVDGFTAGTPTVAVLDGRDALVAIGMNGEPLPTRHGFPARLVVPGLYGFVSATKWLRTLELTTMDAFDAYWVRRGWAKEAPIRTMARIDVPRDRQRVPAGRVAIAGVAWAPHRGIRRVEVQVGKDGPWQEARLGAVPSDDTWRQWVLETTVAPGPQRVRVRATDGDGEVQAETRRPPDPDGATGWHEVTFLARE
jgi:DMSO/TMAO reductase YedYZ molybdopterin-dependent catalytic subunit